MVQVHSLPGRLLLLAALATLVGHSSLAAQSLTSTSKRALDEVLQPSEADLSRRVTPVVRAVRATANSVFNVILLAPGAQGPIGQGSGVIIDEGGLALTNWHVIAMAHKNKGITVQAKLKNKSTYLAKVLSVSREYDLALLQLQLPKDHRVSPVTMGDSKSLMIGETVIAIGNPKGHQNTVTVGVLSADHRSINVRTPDGQIRNYKGLLQTDAAINQGNSGGALLDITGRLIGINNAVSSDSENIGFAIPVNTVRKVFNEILLSSENITTVYLGMQVRPKGRHLMLTKIAPNGPADRAGLQAGDQLVKVNEQPVSSTLDYAHSLNDVLPERPMDVVVLRDGKESTHRPVPLSNAAWSVIRRVGLSLRRITLKDDRRLVEQASREIYRELRQRRGRVLPAVLEVTRVEPDSPSANLGIRSGDILLGIVDRVPGMFGSSNRLQTYGSIQELNDSLHVLANRYRNAEYKVWLLRDGEVLDGPLDVPRIGSSTPHR